MNLGDINEIKLTIEKLKTSNTTLNLGGLLSIASFELKYPKAEMTEGLLQEAKKVVEVMEMFPWLSKVKSLEEIDKQGYEFIDENEAKENPLLPPGSSITALIGADMTYAPTARYILTTYALAKAEEKEKHKSTDKNEHGKSDPFDSDSDCDDDTSEKTKSPVVFPSYLSENCSKVIALFKQIPPSVKDLDLSYNNFSNWKVDDLVALFSAIPATVKSVNLTETLLEKFKKEDFTQIHQAIPKTIEKVILPHNCQSTTSFSQWDDEQDSEPSYYSGNQNRHTMYSSHHQESVDSPYADENEEEYNNSFSV